MYQNVPFKTDFRPEHFRAIVTLVLGRLVNICLVVGQSALRHKALVTNMTDIVLVSRVKLHVILEGLGSAQILLVTDWTLDDGVVGV